MIATIKPSSLKGSIEAISSKSYAHRIIMASALSDRPTRIHINGVSKDIQATVNAVNTLGATALIQGNEISVTPIAKTKESVIVPVSESGTTARMILPIATALYKEGMLAGEGSLLKRPFAPLCNAISDHGVSFSDNHLPIKFEGEMQPGIYSISGKESSQYISALMYALPLLKGKSSINLTSPLASRGYVDITTDVLQRFGVKGGFETEGNEAFISPGEITVEGDMSNAAFWLACGIDVTGLNPNSKQKDILFSKVKEEDEIDIDDIPDLAPILCVYAASKRKTTRLYNAHRLKIKESNRLESTSEMIKALGGEIEVTDDELIVHGTGKLVGGTVDSYNDHRIVMSAAVASTICCKKVVIRGAEAVNKSYPLFFEHFNSLGGKADVQ